MRWSCEYDHLKTDISYWNIVWLWYIMWLRVIGATFTSWCSRFMPPFYEWSCDLLKRLGTYCCELRWLNPGALSAWRQLRGVERKIGECVLGLRCDIWWYHLLKTVLIYISNALWYIDCIDLEMPVLLVTYGLRCELNGAAAWIFWSILIYCDLFEVNPNFLS